MGKIIDKTKTIILAVLGGTDVLIYVITPIILVALWAIVNGLNDWRSTLFYGVGICAAIFRGIKIGWMKK